MVRKYNQLWKSGQEHYTVYQYHLSYSYSMSLMEEKVTPAEQTFLNVFGCAQLHAEGTSGAEGKHLHITMMGSRWPHSLSGFRWASGADVLVSTRIHLTVFHSMGMRSWKNNSQVLRDSKWQHIRPTQMTWRRFRCSIPDSIYTQTLQNFYSNSSKQHLIIMKKL